MELGICAGSISENSSNIDEQQNVHTHSGRYAYQVYMHSNSLHSMNNTYEYLRFCFNWIWKYKIPFIVLRHFLVQLEVRFKSK